MSNIKIHQYKHYPNTTELGQGNTHETYLLVSKSIDLGNMFPPGEEVIVHDVSGGKDYILKSASGREFRINQMGEIYRDYTVRFGDEITLTLVDNGNKKTVYLGVRTFKGVVLRVDAKGVELFNTENFENFDSTKTFASSVQEQGLNKELRISFSERKKKRTDSPTETDFYEARLDGQLLEHGLYFLAFDTDWSISKIPENSLNTIDFNGNFLGETLENSIHQRSTRQQIFFGTPGGGKSHKVKELTKGKIVHRTTFHPDSDYASFVGCYKPTMDGDEIKYNFTEQVFTKAYVEAWRKLNLDDVANSEIVYLVIEEINRGNCAQIFGDLFQLLDRNNEGYSDYRITADSDLRDYLIKELSREHEGIKNGKLCLPPNLYILATMNTSDQSLFPMDSAFKRRWDWEYVPVDYSTDIDSGKFIISIGEQKYSWITFLKEVNERIRKATDSEDKQMGNFFIKANVSEAEFKSKVMFYLWNEVCRDEYGTQNNIFRSKQTDKEIEFSFNELYQADGLDKLHGFMAYLGVSSLSTTEDTEEESEDPAQD